MDIVGYCDIKKDAKTCKWTKFPEKFIDQGALRVMEFDQEGGVLALARDGSCLAMFDACDVYRKFECTVHSEYILPPKLDMLEQGIYVAKLMNRKGGYNNLLKAMVIQGSLMKGKYNDDFLFQIENEERAGKSYSANG